MKPINKILRITIRYSYGFRKYFEIFFSFFGERCMSIYLLRLTGRSATGRAVFSGEGIHRLSGIVVFFCIGRVPPYHREHPRDDFGPYDVQYAHRMLPFRFPSLVVVTVFTGQRTRRDTYGAQVQQALYVLVGSLGHLGFRVDALSGGVPERSQAGVAVELAGIVESCESLGYDYHVDGQLVSDARD